MTGEPHAAQGFIPVAGDVDRTDADVMAEIERLAQLGVAELGSVVGDIDLTWDEDRGGFDARCMVIPAA